MKTPLLILVTLLSLPAFADQQICFNVKTVQPVTDKTCGPVQGHAEIKNCETNQVAKVFDATWGVDCLRVPISINLQYKNKMLVGEFAKFDGVSQLILSKSFSMLPQRSIASEITAVKGSKCFSMIPLESPNATTCAPVDTQIQVHECSTKKPLGPRMEVKAHFTCRGKVKKLKYWYKDSLLVGVLKKSGNALKVSATYNLVYPQIYGAFEEPSRSTASH